MERVSPDILNNIPALTNNHVDVFGALFSREVLIMAVMAALFFLGVIVGCVLKLNGKARPLDVLLGSILVFFLSTPVSARVLNGDWATTNVGAVDQIVKWVQDSGPLPNTFFAFGIVMAFGLMAWPIFQIVLRILRRMLGFIDSKANPPAGSGRAPT